jgi:hypothetical protein
MMKKSRQQALEYVNVGGALKHASSQNQMIELSPHHFKNKETNNWLNLFTAYTHNYLQEAEEKSKYKKRSASQ